MHQNKRSVNQTTELTYTPIILCYNRYFS